MIDTKSREELASVVEDYLDDRISAFTFDQRIHEIETCDDSVSALVANLWSFYDDCKDHKAVLNKVEWDFMQRVLLFLRTDNEIADSFDANARHARDWSQWLALSLLLAQVVLLIVDFSFLISVCLIGAIASYLIFLRRESLEKKLFSKEERTRSYWLETAYYPFTGYGEIAQAVKTTGFRKARYPKRLLGRRIRSWMECKFMDNIHLPLTRILLYVLFSPLILLYQCFPVSDRISSVHNELQHADKIG